MIPYVERFSDEFNTAPLRYAEATADTKVLLDYRETPEGISSKVPLTEVARYDYSSRVKFSSAGCDRVVYVKRCSDYTIRAIAQCAEPCVAAHRYVYR